MSPFTATRRACMVVTLRSGMRRILKRPMPADEYIRKAVNAGVYRTRSEIDTVLKERAESSDDLRTIMRRFRQDIVRGTSIHDYPVEYLILEQHPPVPDPPRVPKKYLKEEWNERHPVDELTRKYLNRNEGIAVDNNENDNDNSTNEYGEQTAEDYYRTLLGVQRAQTMRHDKTLQQKPAVVQKAYAMALRHYELQRTEPGGLTDAEAMAKVDELLRQENRDETAAAHAHRRKAEAFRRKQGSDFRMHDLRKQQKQQQQQQQQQLLQQKQTPDSSPFAALGAGQQSLQSPSPTTKDTRPDDENDADSLQNTVASIFGNAVTVEGMMRWSERLRAVPYTEWTVGASTALDHWIARQILGLSEETWQLLLEGEYSSSSDDSGLLAKGRDIVAVREALFPETVLEEPTPSDQDDELHDVRMRDGGGSKAIEDAVDGDEEEEVDDTEKSIEELLESLGGLNMPSDDDSDTTAKALPSWQRKDTTSDTTTIDNLTPQEIDQRTEELMLELQEWRAQQQQKPYEQWTRTEQQDLERWIRERYVATLIATPAERARVDVDSTRRALLAAPPASPEESRDFWDPLRDDDNPDAAEALLDRMRAQGPPPGASILQAAFWDLPRDQQLERLLNLGALRPVLDEYASETDRRQFLQRHGDALLQGVELEHLVPDPHGPIRQRDLGGPGSDIVRALQVPDDARFRLERRPYRSVGKVSRSGDSSGRGGDDDDKDAGSAGLSAMERSRALYKAWNEFKAGRARYEEEMFREGKLGLKYGDETEEEKAERAEREDKK